MEGLTCCTASAWCRGWGAVWCFCMAWGRRAAMCHDAAHLHSIREEGCVVLCGGWKGDCVSMGEREWRKFVVWGFVE